MNQINDAKNLCDEGATNDMVIGRFLKAQEIPHLNWLLPQAAKILHSATLRPKFASQTLSHCLLDTPSKSHLLRMTRRECEHSDKNVLMCVLKLHYRRGHADGVCVFSLQIYLTVYKISVFRNIYIYPIDIYGAMLYNIIVNFRISQLNLRGET